MSRTWDVVATHEGHGNWEYHVGLYVKPWWVTPARTFWHVIDRGVGLIASVFYYVHFKKLWDWFATLEHQAMVRCDGLHIYGDCARLPVTREVAKALEPEFIAQLERESAEDADE